MNLCVVRRLTVLLLATLAATAALAGPALAHGRGSESTNYSSRILEAPAIDGVAWEVIGGDQFLAVTNTSGAELTVTGYRDEPYLRIGPEGVFENRASEATYVNTDRYGEVGELPPDVGPDQEPRWSKVGDTPTYAWHDHRIHWMSTQKPPTLVDESRETLINPWEVQFSHDGDEHVVAGELHWVPPPSPLPWLAIAAVLTLPALLGLRRRGERGEWVKPLVRPAAAVLLVVSLLNITHLVDDFLAVPLPLTTQVVSAIQTALFIALGVFGALVAWRGRDGAFTALGVGSGGILIGQGLLYLSALTSSQSASVFPDWLARLVIALSLLQALWVLAVAVVGNRRLADEEPEEAPAPAEVTAT